MAVELMQRRMRKDVCVCVGSLRCGSWGGAWRTVFDHVSLGAAIVVGPCSMAPLLHCSTAAGADGRDGASLARVFFSSVSLCM